MIYAGFWRRVGAWCIDVILLGVAAMTFQGAVAVLIPVVGIFIGWALWLPASWLYFAFFESSTWQGTMGKRALDMQVTDLQGRRIGFGRATVRYFGRILSTLTLGIGFLLAAFTEKKQTLHDLIAECVVLRRSVTP